MLKDSTLSRRASVAAAVITALLMTACQDEPASSVSKDQEQTESTAQTPVKSSPITSLAFDAPAYNLLIDDFDADGRQDIALTSHHNSYTQLFMQHAPRVFTPGQRVDAVGFHPGELIRLPVPDRRLYLMNSEGLNLLQVMEPAPEGNLVPVATLGVPAPRTSTLFEWPGWGLGIAIGPFATSAIFLTKDFNPLTAQPGGGVKLPFRPGVAHAHNIAAADLEGDGVDELLFANNISNVISVIRAPQPGKDPEIEELWRFKPGGRADDIIPADMNRDGHIDLLIPDATAKAQHERTDINVLLNDGSGGFQALEIPFRTRSPKEGGMPGINALDYGVDQDGLGYIAAAGYEALVLMRVPAGWPETQLEQHAVPFKGLRAMTQAQLRDIDGDGWLDLAMAATKDHDSGFILYGPLWENMGQLAKEGVKID